MSSSNGTTGQPIDSEGGQPRICHVMKWEHFDGYGFNLHAEKGKPGQFIGKVDDASPAEAAGLRQGDRILEVNGTPIGDKNHKQVVDLIKSLAGEAKLLVVEQPASMVPGLVIALVNDSPDAATASANDNVMNGSGNHDQHATRAKVIPYGGEDAKESKDVKDDSVMGEKARAANGHSDHTGSAPSTGGKLNLKQMTAAELRAKLANKKKHDVRTETMDFKKKFDIVQKL